MGNAMVKISRGRVHFEDWEGFGLLDPLIGMLPFLNTYGWYKALTIKVQTFHILGHHELGHTWEQGHLQGRYRGGLCGHCENS